MTDYEAPSFDIQTDPSTVKVEAVDEVFYIFDAPSILAAIDRGATIRLDGYNYSRGRIIESELRMSMGRNVLGQAATIFDGSIHYDSADIPTGQGDTDYEMILAIRKASKASGLKTWNTSWNNAELVLGDNAKHSGMAVGFAQESKVIFRNDYIGASNENPNYSVRLVAPPKGHVTPLGQMIDTVKMYAATLSGVRKYGTPEADQRTTMVHYVTPDGMLFYHDGHYSLKSSGVQHREKITIQKPTEQAPTALKPEAAKPTEQPPIEAPSLEKLEADVTLNDIGGLEDAKKLMHDIANSFKNRAIMEKWGAKRPNGVMLYGPPGTGKTTLARALANAVDGKLWEIKTSEIFDKWLGTSEKNLQALFDKAEKIDEPTVMLWDEFEAIVPNTTSADSGASRTQNAVVGIFKQGIEKLYANPNLIIMAATNNIDTIDEPIIRAGRFDEKRYIPLPDEAGRAQIWAAKLGSFINWSEEGFSRVASDIDFPELAKQTEDWSGADIKACVQGLLFAKAMAEADGQTVGAISQEDLAEQIDRTKVNKL